MPKIESLAKDVAIRALSVAGGSEVAKSLGITLAPHQVKAVIEEDVITGSDLEGSVQPESSEGRSDPEGETEDPDLLSAEEIGFTGAEVEEEVEVEAKPVIVKKPMSMPSIKHPKSAYPTLNSTFLGLAVIGG
jgi:hypothetical protein